MRKTASKAEEYQKFYKDVSVALDLLRIEIASSDN
jgi:hypothetical protein